MIKSVFYFQGFGAVFGRLAQLLRQRWVAFVLHRVVEPCIILYALGFGLGAAFDSIEGVPYLNYVVPGIMCSSVLFLCFVEGTYLHLARHISGGVWSSQLAATLRPKDILLAETAWAGVRGVLTSLGVFVIGYATGGIESLPRALLAVPVLWLLGCCLASFGHIFSARAKNYEDFDLLWPIVMTPMFMFSGIFIVLEFFPQWVQNLVFVYPLAHGVQAVRGIVLGTLPWQDILLHITALLVMWGCFFSLATYLFNKRMFD